MIALIAIALPLLVVHYAPAPIAPRGIPTPQTRVVAKTELPPVEPLKLIDLPREDAQAINAKVPLSTAPNPPARPFRFLGGGEDFARATDCLAAAVYYEAGDDATGEKAVAQVILNRLRHPAFPKTICGVVFQGAERSTGCQFTFTCDGAMARYRPSEAAWTRARDIATSALQGKVYKPVGYATHYHTDWVVPYWSASLDKIAIVDTHLFFRWTGWWGTPPAFNRGQAGGEQPVAQMAALSTAHGGAIGLASADGMVNDAVPFFGRTPAPLPNDPDTFLTALNPAQAGTFQAMALSACGDRPKCRVMGWTDPGLMGFVTPLTAEQIAGMSFSYIRDRPAEFERTLWNCGEFRGRSPCMKQQVLDRPAPPREGAIAPPTVIVTRTTPELTGVRRKEPAPDPTPTATQ
ncbi:cell wall hydrolase [Sphingomonas sp. SUN019]|uniref:cell wall hydrolase n=1 Tax=Sphingomonas sp. SUN019 TaxID=2937788 RepID=UPI002164B414|nr:cell wall hydrolase [Sphingomonas sp. SUN019]UVO49137.1 cell wall hydrolase [Sphingomonas sp. SUN019]